MNAENVDQILGVLAERFGTTAAHLWDVLILQAYVEFTVAAVLLVGALGASWFVFSQRDADWAEDRMMGCSMPYMFAAIGAAVALILAAVAFATTAGYAINPEYFVLRKVLGAF